VSTGAVRLLTAAVFSTCIAAQESRTPSAPPVQDRAEALLAQLDARIYSAERAGLHSAEFSYRPSLSGPRETTPFRVHVRWQKGQRETVAFEQADGSAFAELHEMLRQPSAVPGTPSSKEMLEQGARALVDLFRGVPYSERFAKWTKRFDSRMVNGREERMLVCEPVAAGHFRRAELALDHQDLPWRVVWFLARPEGGMDRLIDEPVWTEIDGKLLMTSFKKTWGPKSEQVVVKYLRKDGFLVPSSYEKLNPGKPPVEFVFEDIILNAAPSSRPDSR
jgi:hypothetical protein